MRVYKVSPIISYSPFFSLTYISKVDFLVGDVVEVDFNRRSVKAVVLEVYDLKDVKVEIRKADFQTKKILSEKAFRRENGEAIFTPESFASLKNFSEKFLIPLGEILFFLFTESVDLTNNPFLKTFEFKENTVTVEDFNFEKYTLLTNPKISRLHLLFIYLEHFYNFKKIEVVVEKSFLCTLEKLFIANFKSKNISIVVKQGEIEKTKKFFVNVNEEEIINQEVLTKISNPPDFPGDKKGVFVFVLSRGYADRIYCKDCKKQYDCTNCGHGYSLLNEEDGRYLYCKMCHDKKVLKPDQYLICRNCGGWGVFPFGTGIEKVKEFLLQNNLGEELKSKKIKVGSVRELNKILQKKKTGEKVYDKVVVASLGPLVRAPFFDSDEKLIYLLSKLESITNELYINKRTGDEVSLDNFKAKDKFIETELANRAGLQLPPYGKVVSINFLYTNKKFIDKYILENLDYLKDYQELKKGNKYTYFWILKEQDTERLEFACFKNLRSAGDLTVSNTIVTSSVSI